MVVQETKGSPDYPVLSLLKVLEGHMATLKSKDTLPASGRTSKVQQDLLMATSVAPTAVAQEAAAMAAQESSKAHPSGPGWPTDPTKQADTWLSGLWCPGAWVGHGENQLAWQQSYWTGSNTLPEHGIVGGNNCAEASAPLGIHLHPATRVKFEGGILLTCSHYHSENQSLSLGWLGPQ